MRRMEFAPCRAHHEDPTRMAIVIKESIESQNYPLNANKNCIFYLKYERKRNSFSIF